MNRFIDILKNRRSTRRYLGRKVPKKIINEIIDSGQYAPSSHNRQPWNFKIITNQELLDEISRDIRKWYKSFVALGKPLSFIREIKKAVREMEGRVKSEKDLFFYHAPALVIVHAPKKDFFAQDCACCAQNMMLAARSLDIGSCWIGFADIVFNNSNKIRKKIGIPSGHRIYASVVLGYPVKFPSSALPRRESKMEWME